MSKDLEKGGIDVTYVEGYPSLAAFIASDRDHSSVVYKRFDRLSARNILYLQSELQELQSQQDKLDKEDGDGDDFKLKRFARDYHALAEASKNGDAEAVKRMKLVKNIREKMKEYSKRTLMS